MDDVRNVEQWKQYVWYLLKWAVSHQAIQYVGQSPLPYDEWLNDAERENDGFILPECDSEYCAFNPNGYCWVPLIYARQPGLSDDGCTDFIYRE